MFSSANILNALNGDGGPAPNISFSTQSVPSGDFAKNPLLSSSRGQQCHPPLAATNLTTAGQLSPISMQPVSITASGSGNSRTELQPLSTRSASKHHNTPSANSKTLPSSSRCTMSLFYCFIFTCFAFTGMFISVTWVVLNHAAVSSVDSLSSRLHTTIQQELEVAMVSFLEKMSIVARFQSVTANSAMRSDQILNSMCRALRLVPGPSYLLNGRSTGQMLAVKRTGSGDIVVGERLPDCDNSSCTNLTYYTVDADCRRGAMYSTVPFDPRVRPWYSIPVSYGMPAFTPPYMHVTEASVGISIGIPLFATNGTVSGVIGSDFAMSSVTHTLQDAHEAIATTGILLLVDIETMEILTSSSPMNLNAGDLALVNSLITHAGAHHESGATRIPSRSATFDAFGDSFVLGISFTGENFIEGFSAEGLHWHLIAILPKSDYYTLIWNNNKIIGGVLAAAIFLFLVVLVLLLRFVLVRPLHRLQRRLIQIKDAFDHRSELTVDAHDHVSRFTEIAGLHFAAAAALDAARADAQLRLQEKAQLMEEQMKQAEVQRNIQAKSLFFAVMSHEMRTPLTACIGMAEILLETPLTEKQLECVEAIELSGSTLLALVNDILDFNKLEADKLVLEMVAFSVRECVENVASMMQVKAEEKGLELIICVMPNVPDKSVGDSARLSQVLLNLLSNAIKFTPSGFVMIVCTAITDESRIYFEVRDSGIGLTSEVMSRLFQPFVQADASMNRQYGGTGLGLVISKRIVELMGGDLIVSSEGEGKGSCFSFSIHHAEPGSDCSSPPLQRASSRYSTPTPELRLFTLRPHPGLLPGDSSHSLPSRDSSRGLSPPIGPANGVNVLLIDEFEPRRWATTQLLAVFPLRVRTVASLSQLANGIDDVWPAILIATPSDTDPADQIIEFARKLSAAHPEFTPPRIIFLTSLKKRVTETSSSALNSISSNALFISKPVTLPKLRQALAKSIPGWTNEHRGSTRSRGGAGTGLGTAGSSGEEAIAERVRVLVVDDVAINQKVIAMKLQQRGYKKIDVANSGVEALTAIQKATFVYDVILMDVMMPIMDGYEATRQIKHDPRYANVPIIGVTGNCAPDDIRICLESGMCAVVAKPINTAQLFRLLQKHVLSKLPSPTKAPVTATIISGTNPNNSSMLSVKTLHDSISTTSVVTNPNTITSNHFLLQPLSSSLAGMTTVMQVLPFSSSSSSANSLQPQPPFLQPSGLGSGLGLGTGALTSRSVSDTESL